MKEKWNLELSEYIKQGEPTQVEKTKKLGNSHRTSRSRWFKAIKIFS